MFFQGSRYQNVATAQLENTSIQYKLVRLIPPTPAVVGHTVIDGERLDQISYNFYKDAQRFWRICDANSAMWPDDLTRGNATLLIPPSEG